MKSFYFTGFMSLFIVPCLPAGLASPKLREGPVGRCHSLVRLAILLYRLLVDLVIHYVPSGSQTCLPSGREYEEDNDHKGEKSQRQHRASTLYSSFTTHYFIPFLNTLQDWHLPPLLFEGLLKYL